MIPLIAAALSALVYFHNDIFIDFADEGFLWYGVTHLLAGQFPIRDFQSYDPGRYYWCAAVFSVLGNGLMNLRLAAGLFQFTGLCLGLSALKRVLRSPWQFLAAGFLAISWMLIPCRYFDASLALLALYFAARLAEKPSARRHFAAGVFAGLVFFMGLNHGLYTSAGFFALILYLRSNKWPSFFGGLAVGLAPFWTLFLTAPGFWESYLERLSLLAVPRLEGQAGVALKIPWPWTVRWEDGLFLPDLSARLLHFVNRFSIGSLFVFVILYYLFAVWALFRLKIKDGRARALFAASVLMGFFYLGHIFARSDVNYLGEGVFPVLAGLVALAASAASGLRKRLAAGALVLFSVLTLAGPGLVTTLAFKTFVPKSAMTWYPVGRDRIWLLHSDALYIDSVKALVSKVVGPKEPILLAPLLTTFYCLLEKESPLYELYFHIAPLPSMDARAVEELKRKDVRWAIIANIAVDGRPEQTFSVSHPLLWRYLTEHFEPVTNEGLRPGYFLVKRRSGSMVY